MAQIFSINDNTLTYPTKANWPVELVNQALDGRTPHKRWTPHIVVAEAMTEAEWDTIYAFEGQRVNLTTTNYNDRNGDYLTYYGVDFQSISGDHDGPLLKNVSMSFLIRL